MKLILTQEVSGLGGPGDIVEVKDGYGRNFLVPRGLGMLWTRGGEKQVAAIRRGRDVREVRDLGQAQELASQLAALKVTLPSRAGQGGRLFGSVTAADVVDAVKTAGGPALDKRRVELPAAHIKTVGTHTVSVRLHPKVVATVAVEVTPED
jgi:large subunit ribosomal protein L9